MNGSSSLPDRPREEGGVVVVTTAQRSFTGPIPDPGDIEKYEKIYPGAAEMIFKNWNTQVEHRQAAEKAVIQADISRAKIGLWLGFFIVMTAIVAGIYTTLQGRPLFGGGLTFTGLAMLAAAFTTNIWSKTIRRKAAGSQKQQGS